MLDAIFATKLGMTQAWSKNGKRLAVTKCKADDNLIVGMQTASVTDKSHRVWAKQPQEIIEVGFGEKKLKNMKKPLRSRLEKSGFSLGAKRIQGVRHTPSEESPLQAGDFVSVEQVLSVGDVVKVQGTSKGRGFSGAVKRYGFAGGPKTHGQSDRERAVGSIGAGTTPGRVWKGKRMPGHYGVDTKTVSGLVVLHIDAANKEIWLSGPVPGANTSIVRIEKTGQTRPVDLDLEAVGLAVETPAEEVVEPVAEEKIEEAVEEVKVEEAPAEAPESNEPAAEPTTEPEKTEDK